jgi:hypothetical protein
VPLVAFAQIVEKASGPAVGIEDRQVEVLVQPAEGLEGAIVEPVIERRFSPI